MVLPDDSIKKWEYTEHGKVKHEILSKYISGWINILGGYYDLNIFDCFAGRGRFSDGSEGSPIKFLNILCNFKKKRNKPNKATCFFIEADKSNYLNLEKEIAVFNKKYSSWLSIYPIHGEFTNKIDEIVENYKGNISPSFFFLDPFGFGGIPLHVIKKIMQNDRTEVFINFMIRDVNRFIESPPHQNSIEELFGVPNVGNLLKNEYYSKMKKEQAILKLYRKQLHNEAEIQYTFPFKVNADKKLQTTYYLIHCTNHPKGCSLMKAIMYNAGTKGRFAYLGPAEGQLSIIQFTNIFRLKQFLLRKFKNQVKSFLDIQYETLMDTWCIERHYRKAVRSLIKDKLVIVSKLGPKGGIKDNTIIDFSRNFKKILNI